MKKIICTLFGVENVGQIYKKFFREDREENRKLMDITLSFF